jgi:hypothetical protein
LVCLIRQQAISFLPDFYGYPMNEVTAGEITLLGESGRGHHAALSPDIVILSSIDDRASNRD